MKSMLILCLVFLIQVQWICAQTGEPVDWEYELELLARELSEKHPGLFFERDSAWFFQKMSELASRTPDRTLFQVSIEIQQLIADMGDAHTQINYHFLIDKSRILPLDCYWFEDGIYVLETDRRYEAALGKKLIAINGFPINVVIDSLATLLVLDNPSVLKNRIPRMLTWVQLLEYFGFSAKNELSLTVSGSAWEEVPVFLPYELGELVGVRPPALPLGWQEANSYFREQYFDAEKLYYIQYNRCWSREAEEDYGSGASALFMPSFKEFEKQVLRVLRKEKIDKLVFDLRFNRGGHAEQGTEFIRKIKRTLPKKHGEVFLLVGRGTEAEALINAVDLIKSMKVMLVGEESSGKPNHFGEVKRFVLPESGLVVSYPGTYFSLLEEDPSSLEPEVKTHISFEQYMQGIDPALEAVRRY